MSLPQIDTGPSPAPHTPQPAAAPSGAPALTGGAPAAGAGDFLATLPEALRGEPSLKDVKDVGTLAKNFVETKKLVGASVRIPAADAKPEELEAFYAKLRPAKPEDYAFEAAPDKGWDPAFAGGFRAVAHKAGLTPPQAQALAGWLTEQMAADTAAAVETYRSAEATLKTAWGAEYAAKLELADRALRRYAGDADKAALKAAGLHNAPWLITLLADRGAALEDLRAPQGTGGAGQPGAEEAKRQIEAYLADPAKAKAYHAGDAKAVAEVTTLFGHAYGSAPVDLTARTLVAG